ncbi:gamma-glutamylcyclotransferase family protein [uncultured Draconibacterium sp.]|uniref:gamma-glutamylcyclotransferase family protein n=1 Tax=uncultured Draconibacterium sp. TaxID=1573823 RepID=UPI0029C68C59|nr:gamma-glutamylcyclotransferase family protein [uncultured Draconibacterium sp.]
MTNVFVYGSLLFSEIADGLCGQTLTSEDATIRGFSRFALKEADYPAIVPYKNAEVTGKILLNLEDEAIKLLTFYEGDEYEIAPVKVKTNSGIKNAIAFVWIAGNEFLEDVDWDTEQFKSESLEFYRDEIIPATRKEFYRTE